MIDKNLFIYLTKKAGYSTGEVAEKLGLPPSGLYKRINGEIEFRRDEMEAWMALVGVANAGPVFFPASVAKKQQDATEEEVVAYGG